MPTHSPYANWIFRRPSSLFHVFIFLDIVRSLSFSVFTFLWVSLPSPTLFSLSVQKQLRTSLGRSLFYAYILWLSPAPPPPHTLLSIYVQKHIASMISLARESRATLRPTSTTTTSLHSRCLLTRLSPATTALRRTSTCPPSDTRPCIGWERVPALEPTKTWSSTPRRQ